MDLKQIKQIIELMKRSELTEFAVEEEGFKLKIRRGPQDLPVVSNSRMASGGYNPEPPPAHAPSSHTGHHSTGAAPATGSAQAAEEPGVIYVKSPMVGTFYRAPTPESKPFAENGTVISETAVVCIIEAMKIMNEIQAEVKGTVIEVLVENGQPVEYGQRLFKVKQG